MAEVFGEIARPNLTGFLQSELQEGCSAKLKMDGVYIIGHSWNFLKPSTRCVTVKFPLLVREVQKNRIKGSQIFNTSRRIWSVKLASVMDFHLQLMLYSTEDARINYKSLLFLITRAIQRSLSRYEGSETWASDLQEVFKCGDGGSGEKKIHCCDFLTFGGLLKVEMNKIINTHSFADQGAYHLGLTDLDFKFMAWSAGQSADYDLAIENCLANLTITHMEELIIHTAIDIKREGFTAMWNRANLVKSFGRQPNYEYYPVGMPGVGNFYYHSREQAESVGEPQIKLAKFYSSVAKFFHAQTPKPFMKAEIAEGLLISSPSSLMPKTQRNRHKLDLERYFKQSNTILEYCNEGICHTNDARFEAVISILRPEFNYKKRCVEVLEEYLKCFRVISGLTFFDSFTIHHRFRGFVLPAISLIKQHLENVKSVQDENSNEVWNFSLSDFMSVAAAECIISFMIYGSCVSMQSSRLESRRRHSNEICADLGLITKNFRVGTAERDIFGGKISILNGILCYEPNQQVVNCLQRLKLPEGLSDFQESLRLLQGTPSRLHWQEAARLFVKVICLSCIRAFDSGGRHPNTIKATMNMGRIYSRYSTMSSFELVEWLKNPSDRCDSHGGLLWCFERLNELVVAKTSADWLSIWEENICDALDDEMYKSGSFMHFPVNSVSYLVLPLAFGKSEVNSIQFNTRVVGAIFLNALKRTYCQNVIFESISDNFKKERVMQQITKIMKSPHRFMARYVKMNVIVKYIISNIDNFSPPVPQELGWLTVSFDPLYTY